MEEDNDIKRKKIFRKLFKGFSYVIITAIVLVVLVLVLFIASAKIAENSNKKPAFGLYTIISPSMEPNIKVYDAVFVIKKDVDKLVTGDIITFYSTNPLYGGRPITHRIVERLASGEFVVKGDANEEADPETVPSENIIGKVIIKAPGLGKLQFFVASKSGWLIAIIIPALAIIVYDIYKLIKLIVFKIKMKKNENKHGNI